MIIRKARRSSVGEKGDKNMAFPEQAMVQEVFKRLDAAGKKDHVLRTLTALKNFDDGYNEGARNNFDKAVELHEKALEQLKPVTEASGIRAVIKAQLVPEYGQAGRIADGVAIGKEVIEELQKDPRLEHTYAHCLLNIGALLVYSDPRESISYLERAKLALEMCADGRAGLADCLENLKTAEANLKEVSKRPQSKPGLWSRIFGKG